MNKTSESSLRIADTETLAEEWALVLTAEGLSPSVRPGRNGFILYVPSGEVKRAAAALSAYESENPAVPEEDEEPVGPSALRAALAVAGALLAFFFVTVELNPSGGWFERGSADAQRILRGEFWRTVTALTLHADLVHAVANAVAGALFLNAVCRALGTGLGCALVLLAGAGGNLVNAFFHGTFHVSVGASTSVFGALGMLGGIGVTRRRRRGMRGRRAWVPIAAGFALLAILGTGGQRVDLWAHLFGFLVGGVLAIPLAFFFPRPPGLRVQWTLGSAALWVIIACWTLALR